MFKKDDSVICSDYGIGYIISIQSGKYPIEVEFQSDNSVVTYTIEGSPVEGGEQTLKKKDHNWRP